MIQSSAWSSFFASW